MSGAANTQGCLCVATYSPTMIPRMGLFSAGSYTANWDWALADGWEPQLVMFRVICGDWLMIDTCEVGHNTSGYHSVLFPNTAQRSTANYDFGEPTATGWQREAVSAAGASYIYLAIRRPNKPPTSGTEVYNA